MGTLYSVATPIGNLEDITFRALNTLKNVDLILCEDTRVTSKLLKRYEIVTPTKTYHQHTSDKQITFFLDQLKAGKNIAIVSDAGTPSISDPGTVLIAEAISAGITVTPIPGASAIITALQAAGVRTATFSFLGFIPHKKGRQTLLNKIATEKGTMVFYESPHRILKTLAALQDSNRHIVIGRELTKMHEEFVAGTAKEVYEDFANRPKILGEFVVIVHDK
ncbi:MAG: 16S rRNA (cytidine(1402)-2'-O)-methyltransferase [bacterium]|nr:16S rRNA (cytidine(1402)-2'-O)-methyltransferase [bacterium]